MCRKRASKERSPEGVNRAWLGVTGALGRAQQSVTADKAVTPARPSVNILLVLFFVLGLRNCFAYFQNDSRYHEFLRILKDSLGSDLLSSGVAPEPRGATADTWGETACSWQHGSGKKSMAKNMHVK